MKKAFPHIVFFVLLLAALLPALQMRWSLITVRPLNGAFQLAEKPAFSFKEWMNGTFQAQTEKYLKDHSGFRSFFIRLQNQADFTLFRQTNAEGAVVGKKGQLFEYDYIRSWLALDYPGDPFLEKKMLRTKYVQEYLRREKGIDMIVVFEPGKASFYPEYLPSSYQKQKKGPSTYENYVQKARELGIDYIDLQQYFLQLKDQTEYPIFPRYGTHWSFYGMKFAADSLIRLIEQRRKIDLTGVEVNEIQVSSKPRDTDDDVLKTMNLLLPLHGEDLAYPQIAFDTLHPGDKPMVLVVADSYYWNIFNTRIPKFLFANEAFWYFNTVVYPENYYRPTYTKDLDFQKEIEKQDMIFLMVTERFVHKFDWRFIDQLYALYTPDWLVDPVYDKINDIMQVEPWYEKIINKAAKKHITLEKALVDEGEYLYRQSDTAGFMIFYGHEYFRDLIANDPKWMEYIRKKAQERGITADEMLDADAGYTFHQDFPVLSELNTALNEAEARIRSDKAKMASVISEASWFYFDQDQFIRLKAWQDVREAEIARTCDAILKDTRWLEDVRKKAAEKGIPMEEMMKLDAEYMWEQKIGKY